jgi:cell division protease FtsH
VLLGGRAAESIVLDDISTGASSDIERATKIARSMVTKFGMSDRLGPVAYGSDSDEVFLGRDYAKTSGYSDRVSAEIDLEIHSIIGAAYDKAKDLLTNHIDRLHAVAAFLFQNEKMSGAELKGILNGEPAALRAVPAI